MCDVYNSSFKSFETWEELRQADNIFSGGVLSQIAIHTEQYHKVFNNLQTSQCLEQIMHPHCVSFANCA